jgi:hypothetical protein
VNERQKLYQGLCEMVWDPARLGFNVPKIDLPERRVARRSRARYDVTISDLVATGAIKQLQPLTGEYKGQQYTAVVQSDGRIMVESGELFNAPSPAAMFLINRQACNGWEFWKVRRGSRKITLKSIRDDALRSGVLEKEKA